MDKHIIFERPLTLIEGKHYILADRQNLRSEPVMNDVKFVAYTSCPAIVIVSNGTGQTMRCLRDVLFIDSLGMQ